MKIAIRKADIFWLFLAIYWILENLAPHSLISQLGMVMMIIVLTLYCFVHKKINISPVLYSYLGLIVLQGVYCILGFPLDLSVTLNNLQTMIICAISGIVMYTFMCSVDDIDKLESFFIYTGLISLLIVFFLCRDNLFIGRMAHAYGEGSVSYYLFGMPVSISSNGIATYSCFGAFFSLIKYYKERSKKFLIYIFIFVVGIALTGSRKGLLMLAAFWGIYEMAIKGNKKYILNLIKIGVSVILGFIIITKIPALYAIIGERLEDLLINKFTGQSVSEGSMSARARYAAYAVEIIKNNYLFGNGLGWFKSIYGNVTENNYYELLVGCGVFGLLVNYSFIPNFLKRLYRYRKNPYCYAMGLVLIVILIMEWGSVVYLSRDMLIFESLFYILLWRNKCGDKCVRNHLRLDYKEYI